ncbi:MAG: hypothetical protein KDB58_12600 [Solirubrobacterales bacterium]|nr:hypothetical protein [Solirubrobacterales bacterium]MCB8970739.1 hypothetical protein [Thermoleophilales bacterium]MCO5327640.1 hypothetical protein [Solirubrobacterales bacterium]
MAPDSTDRIYELDQLANQPGTYFNPQTEVVLIVDDSASVDQDVFDDGDFEGAEWIRISDEVPVDEGALEEALESFSSSHHPSGESVSAAYHDSDEHSDYGDDTLEPDPDEDEDDGSQGDLDDEEEDG